MRIRIAIEGQGPPLLLINGLGANIEMWKPLRRLLSHRQTIAFDAPGAGASDQPTKSLLMRDLADVVDEILRELGHGAVDVLGYSLGGAVAQELARRHPSRVHRLVLAATFPGLGGFQNPVALMELLTLPLSDRQAPGRARTVARVVGGEAARDGAALASLQAAHEVHPPSAAGFAHQLMTISGWSSLPWLHTINVPTLVLTGDQDPLVPAINSSILSALIPDCRVHVFPRGGHLFLLDDPEGPAEVIDDFLGDGDGAGRRSRAHGDQTIFPGFRCRPGSVPSNRALSIATPGAEMSSSSH
jgi:pimeloyl-ACP methyl ester carboxylesterase